MSQLDQIPYGEPLPEPDRALRSSFDNPEPRLAHLLLLDTSPAMGEATLRDIEDGLKMLTQDVRADALAIKRLELAAVTFGPVQLQIGFVPVDEFIMPDLQVGYGAPLGEALRFALDLINFRKALYRQHGVAYYRPTILLITAATPTDDWRPAVQRLRAAEQARKVTSFVWGVAGANMDCLRQITEGGRPPINGVPTRETFLWLSGSTTLREVDVVERVSLPAVNWGMV